MKSYIVIDTEGNGLFKFKDPVTGKPIPADAPGQPRLASLGAVLLNDALEKEGERLFYVKPNGWQMTAEATAVNGLTDEFLHANGVPVLGVLEFYSAAILSGRIAVAFNAQHDLKTMRAELRINGMPDLFEQTPNICAMRGSMAVGIKKASGKGGFPKLSDACAHFEIKNEGEHTALGDAHAAAEIFRRLVALGVAPEAAVHYAKNHPDDTKRAAAVPPTPPQEA